MGSIGAVDVVERAVGTVADEAGTYLATVGVLLLAVAVLDVAISLVLGPHLEDLAELGAASDPAAVAQAAAVGAGLGLLGLVLTFTVLFVALAVSWDAAEGRGTGLRRTWRRYGDRFLPYMLLTVFVGLLAASVVVLGAVLFFLVLPPILGLVVAVYLVLRWYVAPVALLVEDVGVRDAMRRSAALTKGEKVSLLGILLILTLVAVVVSGALSAAASAAGVPPPDPSQVFRETTSIRAVLASAATNYVSQLVSIPLGAATVVHAYRGLRRGESAAHGPEAAGGEDDLVHIPDPGPTDEGEIAWDEDPSEGEASPGFEVVDEGDGRGG